MPYTRLLLIAPGPSKLLPLYAGSDAPPSLPPCYARYLNSPFSALAAPRLPFPFDHALFCRLPTASLPYACRVASTPIHLLNVVGGWMERFFDTDWDWTGWDGTTDASLPGTQDMVLRAPEGPHRQPLQDLRGAGAFEIGPVPTASSSGSRVLERGKGVAAETRWERGVVLVDSSFRWRYFSIGRCFTLFKEYQT